MGDKLRCLGGMWGGCMPEPGIRGQAAQSQVKAPGHRTGPSLNTPCGWMEGWMDAHLVVRIKRVPLRTALVQHHA